MRGMSTLGRVDTREVVLTRDLRAALARLNPQLPPAAITEAVETMMRHDFSRSLLQHNQEFYKFDQCAGKLQGRARPASRADSASFPARNRAKQNR